MGLPLAIFFAVDCDSQLDGAKENNRDNHIHLSNQLEIH